MAKTRKKREWTPPVVPAVEDLKRLLRARFDERKGWVVMFEVRSHTGYGHGSGRYADALALNVWPSAGMALHGFELKVCRSDLHRELREQGKDEIKRHCDKWWLVVPDVELIDGFELPADYGVLVPDRGLLKAHKEAPDRPRDPKGWPRTFVASLVRNAAEKGVALLDARKEIASAEERGRKAERDLVDHERKEHAELERRMDVFARAAGETTFRWASDERLTDLGAALRNVRDRTHAADARRRLIEQLEQALAALKALKKEDPEPAQG